MAAIHIFLQIFSLSLLLSLPFENATSSKDLDTLLQDCAFKALSSPKTGIPYDAKVPNNLTGVHVSAMRLTTRGVHNYKEFQIPIGVIEKSYVKRLVLVYDNLGNFSEKFYPLPNGFSYLTPVLGLLSYSANSGVDLSATKLPELDIRASDDKPILIKFSDVKPVPYGSVPMCVCFDLNGSVHFDILFHGTVCKTVKQGHFSIVVKSNNASSPIHLQAGTNKKKKKKEKMKKKKNKNKNAPSAIPVVHTGTKTKNLKTWIIALCLVGGCILLILVCLLVVIVRRRMKLKEKILQSENNEPLQIKHVAGTES